MILASREIRLLSAITSLSFKASLAIMIVDTGVLNSWVMLLMKSVFISDNFFCLSIEKMVYPKQNINTINKLPDVAMLAVILFSINVFFCGKASFINPGSLITSCEKIWV